MQELQPTHVISVLSSATVYVLEALKQLSPSVPVTIINTDFQEFARYTWFPYGHHYYAITGTEKAYQQAQRNTKAPERVFRSSGMVIRPTFYDPQPSDIAAERERHGLQPKRFTLCVVYGGKGSQRMLELARCLCSLQRDFQVIFVCGRNEALLAELEALSLPYPHLLLPFTKEIPYLFHISDCLIGKPGPGILSEALAMNLPILVDCQHVLPQERYNVTWLKQQKVGFPFSTVRQFLSALEQMMTPEIHERLVATCKQLDNQAIFEIPEILEKIEAMHQGTSTASQHKNTK